MGCTEIDGCSDGCPFGACDIDGCCDDLDGASDALGEVLGSEEICRFTSKGRIAVVSAKNLVDGGSPLPVVDTVAFPVAVRRKM